MNEDRIVGCILGTAVGDAFGLPYEGLSKRRAKLATLDTANSVNRPIRLPAIPLLGRNLLFALVVLCHGFRRLVPPY